MTKDLGLFSSREILSSLWKLILHAIFHIYSQMLKDDYPTYHSSPLIPVSLPFPHPGRLPDNSMGSQTCPVAEKSIGTSVSVK